MKQHGSAPAVYLAPFGKGDRKQDRDKNVFVVSKYADRPNRISPIAKVDVVNDQFKVDLPEIPETIIEDAWNHNFEAPYKPVRELMLSGTWPLSQNDRDIVARLMAMTLTKNHEGLSDFDKRLVQDEWYEITKDWPREDADKELANRMGFFKSELRRVLHNQTLERYWQKLTQFQWALVESRTPFFTGNSPLSLAFLNSFGLFTSSNRGLEGFDSASFPISRNLAIYIRRIGPNGALQDESLSTGRADVRLVNEEISNHIRRSTYYASTELYCHLDDREWFERTLEFGKIWRNRA